MAVEILVKRTLWFAECNHGDFSTENYFRREWVENPPREAICPHCRKWLEIKETSYIGPDIKK